MRTHATSCMWEMSLQNSQILENLLGNIEIFLLLKSNFPHTKLIFFNGFPLSSTAFRFLQRFLIFFNGFPFFLNGFPLSEKSKKIYLRRQVYERSPFELRISRHLLPKLRNCHSFPKLCICHLLLELCNRYNAYISPNTLLWCTCVPSSAPNLKSKLKYNLS
jgi:hypothetical protein